MSRRRGDKSPTERSVKEEKPRDRSRTKINRDEPQNEKIPEIIEEEPSARTRVEKVLQKAIDQS